MSDINEEEKPLNTDEQPATTDNESVNKDNEIINKINNESLPKPTKPKRKIIPPTRPKRDPLPKVRLTTAERNKIIYDYDRGVGNPIWEVVITKTNKKIVRRKRDPEANFSEISGLTKSEPEPKISHEPQPNNSQNNRVPDDSNSDKSWLASIQYYNVQNSFNEQLLKQLDELNNKINHQNNKHKKLKTKYKKLKRSLYSDDSDNEEQPEEVKYNEPIINEPEYEPQTQTQPIRRKLNLRDVTDFTKYGFSPL